ncbi:MAG: NAD(P)/FAD-dependent oxidoreductase [Myxococcales bacterium]|nr:NAD(P)/FAD-dependent oxidoreductase [Myxococcales bacterium]
MAPSTSSPDTNGAAPRHVYAAIIGSGFAGLAAARELRRSEFDDLAILERGDAIGGTWRDNRYPGCACDVPSHLYSLSYAPKHDWSRHYAPQSEIRQYIEELADQLDLRRHVKLGWQLSEARWVPDQAHWQLRAADGRTLTAKLLVLAIGALSNPARPTFPGAELFRGVTMHSANWNHDYDFANKRVAVIGTGASAIQFVPRLQPIVQRLTLVQRTPPWVIPRGDRAFSALEKWAFLSVFGLRWLYRQKIFWHLEARHIAFEHPALMRYVERLGKRHIADSIADPELRARLTPTFTPGCKRVLIADDYYPALAQPNIEVVTDRVTELTETGLVLANGRHVPADALVYGTGFRVHDYLGGMSILGRDGRSLATHWSGGAQAYLGTTISGFPNLFMMTGPNTGLGHNSILVMIEGQARLLGAAARLLQRQQLASIEPVPEVEARYNAWLRGRGAHTVWKTGCTSWYLDDAGRNTTLWPNLASAFRLRLNTLRESDYVLTG